MIELLPYIRNTARAIIFRKNEVLVLRKESPNGECYALPGGGQNLGETLEDALIRECEEELGVTVQVDKLMVVAEWVKDKKTEPPTKQQIVDFLFLCSISEDYFPRNGPKPDKRQIDVTWLYVSPDGDTNISPGYLAKLIPQLRTTSPPTYMGAVYGESNTQGN